MWGEDEKTVWRCQASVNQNKIKWISTGSRVLYRTVDGFYGTVITVL